MFKSKYRFRLKAETSDFVVAETATDAKSEWIDENSTFSGWGTPVGVRPAFSGLTFRVREWDASALMTEVRVRVRENGRTGNILGDVFFQDLSTELVTIQFSDRIESELPLYLEFMTDGKAGMYGVASDEFTSQSASHYATDQNVNESPAIPVSGTTRLIWFQFLETTEVSPVYGEDTSKQIEQESGQKFFRDKLSGKLEFLRDDYFLIRNATFDHEFVLYIDKRHSNGLWQSNWWTGVFYMTDCEFDDDDRICEVQPEPRDKYEKIMQSLEKEYNLIDVAPETVEVDVKIQPLVQIYIFGSSVVTNILSGTYWEQPIQDTSATTDPLFSLKLINDYFFALEKTQPFVPGTSLSGGTLNPDISGNYNYPQYDSANNRYQLITVGAANIQGLGSQPTDDPDGNAESMFIVSAVPLDDWDDFLSIWEASNGNQFEYIGFQESNLGFQMHFRGLDGDSAPQNGTLTHVSGATNTASFSYTTYENNWLYLRNAFFDQQPPVPFLQRYVYVSPSGNIFQQNNGQGGHSFQGAKFRSLDDPTSECRLFTASFYVRYLTNELSVNGTNTQEIPQDDLVASNSRYTRVIGLLYSAFIAFDGNTTTPDRWGRIASNAANFGSNYFSQAIFAPSSGVGQTYPLARSEWTEVSWWFYYTSSLRLLQETGGTNYKLRHCYKIVDAIKALLIQLNLNVTHEEDAAHSEFLYGSNSIRGDLKYPIIAPKSNAIVGEFDKPAQKSNVRLSDILNFLRDFYQVYWFVDDDNRLRLEHIDFFDRGGTYSGQNIETDLTQLVELRSGKAWGYKTSKFKFDKSDMPEQIKHGWMDDSSEPFNGFPIEIRNNYVQKGNFEEKNLSLFTSDIDLIHAQAQSISQDGFVFFEAILNIDNEFVLPFVIVTLSYPNEYKMQNGYAAMVYAHSQYWKYNLPAKEITLNLIDIQSLSIQKKRIQNVTFPSPVEPNPMKLVQSKLGVGQVKKMDINLTSDDVKMTIGYDTE